MFWSNDEVRTWRKSFFSALGLEPGKNSFCLQVGVRKLTGNLPVEEVRPDGRCTDAKRYPVSGHLYWIKSVGTRNTR